MRLGKLLFKEGIAKEATTVKTSDKVIAHVSRASLNELNRNMAPMVEENRAAREASANYVRNNRYIVASSNENPKVLSKIRRN